MYWPSSTDYQEAIQNPQLCFQDTDLCQSKPNLLSNNLPENILGSKAILYPMKTFDDSWAVCCFLEKVDEIKDSFELSQYLSDICLIDSSNFTFLLEGIFVKGSWYPIVKINWVLLNTKEPSVETNQLANNFLSTSSLVGQQTTPIDIRTQALMSPPIFESNKTGLIEAKTNLIPQEQLPLNSIASLPIDQNQAIPPTQIMMAPDPPAISGKKGSDLNLNSQISLDEAFTGTTVSIKIPRLETCSVCYGRGMVNETTKCRSCKGQCKIITEKTFNVNIPPGIKDGERLCLVGEGELSIDGGLPGDLYVNIQIKPHPFFQRDENDLYYTAQITNNNLGNSLQILLLGGKTITITIPTSISQETILDLPNQGMPLVGEAQKGDLHIRFCLDNSNNPFKPLPSTNYQQPVYPNYQPNYSNNPYTPHNPNSVPPNTNTPNYSQQNMPFNQGYQNPRPFADHYREANQNPNQVAYGNPHYYPQQNLQIQNGGNYPIYHPAMEREENLIQQIKTHAMLSFALSVFSLFCLGIFVGPISFFLSRKALKLIRANNIGFNYKAWAIVGQILSIFSFILSGLFFLLIIFDK